MGGYGIHPYKNTACGAPPIPHAKIVITNVIIKNIGFA